MNTISPTSPVNVRVATLADVPFIDALQKAHDKQLGFFPRGQMEEYIAQGWMLIAETDVEAVGYCASRDRYLKRDELGAIFQMCVAPGNQRKLVAATLLQAVFDRAPYGCKLYCCWCAQDIEANHFWEAMGFLPLAFRAGSEKRARTHIFWQKRIRADDETTPYWFPSQTTCGAIGAGRIVLPIPPGTHWSDAKPMILPGSVESGTSSVERMERKRFPSARTTKLEPRITTPALIFGAPPTTAIAPGAVAAPEAKAPKPKAPRPKATKNDPKLIAAARELRDRWLEQVNSGGHAPQIAAKYDVRREIRDCVPALKKVEAIDVAPVRLLEAA